MKRDLRVPIYTQATRVFEIRVLPLSCTNYSRDRLTIRAFNDAGTSLVCTPAATPAFVDAAATSASASHDSLFLQTINPKTTDTYDRVRM